jgi:uncharacterized protein YjbI with pentapeptide repeats
MNKLVILSKLKKNKIQIKPYKTKLYCSNKNNLIESGVNCKKDAIINEHNNFIINVHPDHIEKHNYYTLKNFDDSKYCVDKKNIVTNKTHIECTSDSYEGSKFQMFFDPYNNNKYAIKGGINNKWCNISNNGYLKCDFDIPEYYDFFFNSDDKFLKQNDGSSCNHRNECKSGVCLVNCCLENKDNVGCNLCGIDGKCESCKDNFTWDDINKKCLSNSTLKEEDIKDINNKMEEDCLDDGFKSCDEKKKTIENTSKENQKKIFEDIKKNKEQKCIESGFLNCEDKEKFIEIEKIKLEQQEKLNKQIIKSLELKKKIDDQIKNKNELSKKISKIYSNNSINLQQNYNRIKLKKIITYLIYILVIVLIIYFLFKFIKPIFKI